MNGRVVCLIIVVIWAIAVVLLWPGTSEKVDRTGGITASFPQSGVVTATCDLESGTAELRGLERQLLAKGVVRAGEVTFRYRWEPGKSYCVVVGEGKAWLQAPQTMPQIRVMLHAPLGQEPLCFTLPGDQPLVNHLAVPCQLGESVDLMIEVEQVADSPPVEVRVESTFAVDSELQQTLDGEFDKVLWLGKLSVPYELGTAPREQVDFSSVKELALTLHIGTRRMVFYITLVPHEITPESITVVDWEVPATYWGKDDSRYAAGEIALPNQAWVTMGRWLGIRPETVNYYEPYVYQTIVIYNSSDHPVNLLLIFDGVDPRTGEIVPWFSSPQIESTYGQERVMGFCSVKAGGHQEATLPVYVQPDMPTGTYTRRLTLQVLGSSEPLMVVEEPLGVVRASAFFTSWTAGIGALVLAWLGVFAVGYRRLVNSLGVKRLVLLSLLGSLQFALSFAGAMLSNVTYVVLGPFNCLVGGLLTEVMTYLLVTSILFLVPRVGAMTLAGVVTYLMGGIIFGSFGLQDLLFVGSALALREGMLYLFGVTHFGNREGHVPKLIPMMLALGLSDAAATFTSLVLQSMFYRLYFAPWYIVLQVVVTGFLYTLVGVWLGRTLGMSLRRVHT